MDGERPTPVPESGLTLMRAKNNPLFADSVLFDMYMRALSEVLGKDEIRVALDELNLSASKLRRTLISDARRVLSLLPEEFAAYEITRDPVRVPTDPNFFGVRWAGRILLTAGAALLVTGLVANRIWAWGWILFWAGGTTFIAGGATFALLRLLKLKAAGASSPVT